MKKSDRKTNNSSMANLEEQSALLEIMAARGTEENIPTELGETVKDKSKVSSKKLAKVKATVSSL